MRQTLRASRSRLALVPVLLTVACAETTPAAPVAEDPTEPVVARVVVRSPSDTIEALHETLQLDAVAEDEGGAAVSTPITWSSSDPAVASVDEAGRLESLANGETTITATAEGREGTVPIVVRQVAVALDFISPPQNSWVGEPLGPMRVELRDANGHVATNVSGSFSIDLGAGAASGARLGGIVTQFGPAGVGTFPDVTLDTPGEAFTLVATSTVGPFESESPRFNVTRPAIYVGHDQDEVVTVVDPSDHSFATMPTNLNPVGVAITPDGPSLYVANDGSGEVRVFETATNTRVAEIPVGERPREIAVSPDGRWVYVADEHDFTVTVIDVVANQVVEVLRVAAGPRDVVFDPDGRFAYVPGFYASVLTVIDVTTHEVIAEVALGDTPTAAAVTPDGSRVYVSRAGFGRDLVVVSTATNEIDTTIPPIALSGRPTALAVTPDGSTVLVAASESNTVLRIDTASNTVIGSPIAVGSRPFGMAVNPDGRHAYVSSYDDGTISVIDLDTNTVVDTIDLLIDHPWGIAIMPLPIR